jgi:hypothetical protein
VRGRSRVGTGNRVGLDFNKVANVNFLKSESIECNLNAND